MTADAQDHRLDPVIDFLQRHDHAEASIEIGMRAPEDMDYEYHPASLHLPICGYDLGEGEKTGKGMLVVWLSDDKRSRLYIDLARLTNVKGGGSAVRVEHDTTYITMVA